MMSTSTSSKVTAAGGSVSSRPPTEIPGNRPVCGRGRSCMVPTFVLFKGPICGQMPASVGANTSGQIGWRRITLQASLATGVEVLLLHSLIGPTPGEIDMGPMGVYRMFAIGRRDANRRHDDEDAGDSRFRCGSITSTVEALDAAIERATNAAEPKSCMAGPHEVPGGHYGSRSIIDPQGAMFAMVSL